MFQYRARSTEYEALFDSLGSSSEAGDPRSAIAFWVTRARGAEGGFSARLRRVAGANALSSLVAAVSAADYGTSEVFCARLCRRRLVLGATAREDESAKRSRRFWNSASFPHDARATLTDRREHVQHGGADLQKHLPAMPHDLARRLK